jgi:signal transduction histidine kinase
MSHVDETKQEGSGTPIEEATGRISELEVLESQYRLAEAKIEQQNKFLFQVLESLTHPFYVLDANDYSITLANSAAYPGSLSERPTCYAITHRRSTPCDGAEHICPLKQVKKTGKPVITEHIHYDQEGNLRNVEVHAYPIFDEKGNVAQMIEYTLDITERKKLEKELENYAERIKLFAYSVSHDLKNPIIAIHGLTELLCEQPSEAINDNKKSRCNQILKASEEALNLIEEINIFIRMKEAPLNLEQFNPKEVIDQVKSDFQTPIAERNITWSEPENIPEVRADKMSILRVFRNLVDNALKYAGEDMSEIRIGYKQTGDFHIFSVYDDGAGIGGQSAEKMFETFQRGDKSKEVAGTGLGLAIVKEIAERHGGKAWVEHRRNRGVTFYVSVSKNL